MSGHPVCFGQRRQWISSFWPLWKRPDPSSFGTAVLSAPDLAIALSPSCRRFSASASGKIGGSATDDDGDLTPDAVVCPGGEIRERAAAYLFVELREFAAHDGWAGGAEGRSHVGEGGREPRRGLEEHHRAPLGTESRQCAAPLPRLPRHEALERESVGRETRDGQSCEDGARAREDTHRDPGAGCRSYHPESRVADGRHPGIRQQEHVGRSRELDELGSAGFLVVIVQGDQAGPVLDAERGEEPLRRPGVFRGDHLRIFQRVDEALGRVAEIPDRRGGEDDHGPSLGR